MFPERAGVLREPALHFNFRMTMKLISTYENNQKMPVKYANKGVGDNISPPFAWEQAPPDTKSFALALVDHHPVANEFVHWLVIDIADANKIEEGASQTPKMPKGSRELNTTYQVPGYGGPRPPVGSGDHPYETTIYALNVDKLDFKPERSGTAPYAAFLKALEGKVLAQASLTGLFSR